MTLTVTLVVRLIIKEPAFYRRFQIFRESNEREAKPNGAPRRREAHNLNRPHECGQSILERIDDKIQEEIEDLPIEQIADTGDVLSNGANLENNKSYRKSTSVEPATANGPNLSEPGAKPAMRLRRERADALAQAFF